MENVIISNPEALKTKIKKFKSEGADKIHVLSDFDRTLTTAFVKGQKAHTIIAQLREGKYLTEDYPKKAFELFDKYHLIEINPDIPIKEKIVKMHEWWKKHFELMIKCGISKLTIKKLVKEMPLNFREGSFYFINFLHKNKVPLIIMSASVGDIISEYLKKQHKIYPNIHIVANMFEFDKNSKVVGVKEPIIHVFNKDEATIKHLPVYEDILNRKNVILLGDSMGDLGMVEGFDYDEIIKIGFLNDNIEENLDEYKSKFDIVIINDGSFDCVNDLIRRILG